MKKILSLCLASALTILTFSGCGGTEADMSADTITSAEKEANVSEISSETTSQEEISSQKTSGKDDSSTSSKKAQKSSDSKKAGSSSRVRKPGNNTQKPNNNQNSNNNGKKPSTGNQQNTNNQNNTQTSNGNLNTPSNSKNSKPSSSEEYEYEYEEITYTGKEAIYHGQDPDIYKIGLKNKGDSSRIAALMKKAKKGGHYKIAVLGGSISRGAGASSVYLSYGNLVCEWWCANFPNATFEFINAGFGSTNPEMACYRMGEDLLKQNPDFVVVDFTVNTYLDYNLNNTYATILYKILSQKNSPAVMSIDFTACNRQLHDYSMTYVKATDIPVPEITKVVEEYNIPAMSYHKYIWEKIDNEDIKWRDIGSDYIHPNDNGHMVAANLINAHLKEVMDNLTKYSGKITAPKKPANSEYLNLGYIVNTAKGVTMSGGFAKNINDYADGKGWAYRVNGEASKLTIPIPANKSIKVFMKIDDGSVGSITVTDSNKKTCTISSTDAATPTLVDIGAMSGKITFTPNLTKGGFTIYGIGVRN